MLDRIFPERIDNAFRGLKLGYWLFIAVVLMEFAMGANSIINTRTVVTEADGIPLDRFAGGGAEAVIALFAIAGLFRVLFALLGGIAILRYRAMIPILYLLFLILHVGSKALLLAHPIERSGIATAKLGSAFVLTILGLLAAGFVLSIVAASGSHNRPAGQG